MGRPPSALWDEPCGGPRERSFVRALLAAQGVPRDTVPLGHEMRKNARFISWLRACLDLPPLKANRGRRAHA